MKAKVTLLLVSFIEAVMAIGISAVAGLITARSHSLYLFLAVPSVEGTP